MSTIYEQTTWDASDGWNNHTVRVLLPASELSESTSKLTLKLGYKDASWDFDKVYIGHAAAAGDAYDFDGTQVQVLFSTAAGGTVGVGGLTSDEITYSLDETKNIIVAIFIADAQTVPKHVIASGETCYYKSGDDAATTDATGYSTAAGQVQMVENLTNTATDTVIVGVAFSAIDTFVAGSVFPIFGVALSSVDTFVAGNYGIEINGVALSSVDTFVAGTWEHTALGAFVSTIDEFVAGSILGNPLNKKTIFPNLSGRHISIKVANNDDDGGLSLLYARFKLHKSTDRSRVDTNKCPLPRMDGTHLSIKISHSTEADFIAEYMSTLIDGFRN